MSFLNSLFGDSNEKELKRIWPLVKQIRAKEASSYFQELTLATLPLQTESLKKRLQKGETLDEVLVDGFATVVRACQLLYGTKHSVNEAEQVWDMIPYDVQLVGGIVLHNGSIAEMKTGEGKTLVSTLPVYINALAGNGVHVVTVNDYLAKRDSAWMGVLFKALGLTVGTIVHDLPPAERRAAYACDITYGTNNEYGFDYLRDNMTSSVKRQVQRGLHFAIVDEVDSILIDEARTPLIISQPAGESTSKYREYATLVRTLEEDTHFNKDEKQKVAVLTEEGIKKMEQLLNIQNIYTDKGFEEVHHIEQALRAFAMYQRDTDYVVREGQVVIVDEFTGRLMPGRRYGHGLHQAIEAKEGVEVQRESKTLATITFQNYFRLYEKLSGMTGTAKTEEEEFESIYGLRTLVIPTNKPTVRKDTTDVIYRTTKGKFMAVAELAKEKHSTGQPILIGTTSIEKSEALSKLLLKEGIPHNVLNAKNHEREAQIVASAGQKNAVTIATNMAGRGTDIKLGEGVAALGGLCIAGTERHESRRIDNQLRGRAGRQGDPGETRFFVSMEDELMRLFGGDRLKSLMERMRVPEDQPLENMLIARSIESAQKRVEGRNFDIRRHVVQYDDVMNKHRDIIYKRRQAILSKLEENTEHALQEHSLHTDILTSLRKEGAGLASMYASGNDSGEWNIPELLSSMHALHPALVQDIHEHTIQALETGAAVSSFISEHFVTWYEKKCATYTPQIVLQAERIITLRAIDTHWMDHIDDMAHLREQVAFAGYAQRDPLIEYKDLGFQRFRQLIATIEATIVRALLQVDLQQFSPTRFLAQTEDFDDTITNEAAIAQELETTGVTQAAVQAPGIAAPVHESIDNVPLRRPMPDSIAKFLPKKKK